ncbi:MAG: enoyl-CoA hydratase/isomerase family protein [Pseudomonadales bacterium]
MPVVVGMNGAALGGGYEIALACHHRIAIDRADVKMGLPEAQLGLMPGAGGVVRMVRKFGCQNAITFISQGMQYAGVKALEKGFCDELAATKKKCTQSQSVDFGAEAKQPWDQPGFKIPGGSPADKDPDQGLRACFILVPSM